MRPVHVEVSGLVQGVFYRATCAERAHELGLGGWLRNDPHGGVEAKFRATTWPSRRSSTGAGSGRR